MTNDDLLSNPANWPLVQPGDDIAGHQCLAFYAKRARWQLRQCQQAARAMRTRRRPEASPPPTPAGTVRSTSRSRASGGHPPSTPTVAPTAATTSAWSSTGPLWTGSPGQGLEGTGVPAYGTTVQISTPGGHTQISQVDGGGGHSGKRSFEVSFGLGTYDGPVSVHLRWRDAFGELTSRRCTLTPGTHSVILTSTAQGGSEPMTATTCRWNTLRHRPRPARPARPTAGPAGPHANAGRAAKAKRPGTRVISHCATSPSRSACSTSSATRCWVSSSPGCGPSSRSSRVHHRDRLRTD